jgi:hypothetical protein
VSGRRALAAGVAATLAACAAGGGRSPAEPPPPGLGGSAACFFARDVQDFRELGRDSLLVYAPDRARAYRVQVAPPSFNLRNAWEITFTGGGGRICGNAGERLVLRSGGSAEELAVIDVRRLDAAAVDAAVPAPGTRAPPAPAPGPGPAIVSEPDDPAT